MSKAYVQEHFAGAPAPRIERSVFDRSHCHKTTFNSGKLIPVYCDEALPGDSFKAKMTVFARLSTALKTPMMDNLYMDVHFFAVPNRLVWEHWAQFCGEVKNENWSSDGVSSRDYVIPQITPLDTGHWFPEESLADYFGLPTDQSITITDAATYVNHISVLPFRAYKLIWNEWYRDENLQQPKQIDISDGGTETDYDYPILSRNRRKDYFTSALPWPQKGDSVDVPIGDSAPVYGTGKAIGLVDNLLPIYPYPDSGSGPSAILLAGDDGPLLSNAGGVGADVGGPSHATGTPAFTEYNALGMPTKDQIASLYVSDTAQSGLWADLSDAKAATVNSLRMAFQMQKMLERDARGGTRYTEIIRAHFGVVSPDARLQRPEYLGGGTVKFQTNPVQQTSATVAGQTPQGHLAAFALATGRMGFNKSFVEHSIILGIASVRADNTYQQGISRMWARYTREDFYWPSFAHLGEQAVYNREIYAQGDINDFMIYGYQERYAEYRYMPSKVTSQFRSTHGTPLDSWHLAIDFESLPELADVIVEVPPVQRVVAVLNPAPEIIFDSYIELRCARPMPVYSVPGLIDHF